MPDVRALPLWAGRSMALIGILLVASNVRTAVSAIAPIADVIGRDIPLDAVGLGIIGTIPPIAFALSAIFGAAAARRIGLERLLAIAIVTMIVGHVVRAGSGSYPVLLIGTIVALTGAGIGNVLLPPLVKSYFRDRLGLVTALYVSLVSIGAAIPSALATPVSDFVGWRASLGVWSVVALIGLIPWAAILMQHRRERAALLADGGIPELAPVDHRLVGRIWHSRVAWACVLIFALTSGHVYAAFAWLPQMLVDIAGVSNIEAGALLGLYAMVGVPSALVVPLLAVRMKNVGLLVLCGIGFSVTGYVGLLAAPATATVLWVVLAGAGGMLFPLALVLINRRTHTQAGAVALSGFVQGVGYTIGAFGPLAIAVLHDATDGWVLPLWFLIVTAAACSAAALMLRRPVFVEDELSRVRD